MNLTLLVSSVSFGFMIESVLWHWNPSRILVDPYILWRTWAVLSSLAPFLFPGSILVMFMLRYHVPRSSYNLWCYCCSLFQSLFIADLKLYFFSVFSHFILLRFFHLQQYRRKRIISRIHWQLLCPVFMQ